MYYTSSTNRKKPTWLSRYLWRLAPVHRWPWRLQSTTQRIPYICWSRPRCILSFAPYRSVKSIFQPLPRQAQKVFNSQGSLFLKHANRPRLIRALLQGCFKRQMLIPTTPSLARAHKHPIHKLPLELLVEIFQWTVACPVGISRAGYDSNVIIPLGSLTSTCLLWRKLSLETPRLWTSIKVFLQPIKMYKLGDAGETRIRSQHVNTFHLLQIFLSRSKECPIDLDIDIGCRIMAEDERHLLSIVQPHLWRCRSLVTSVTQGDITAQIFPLPSMPYLDEYRCTFLSYEGASPAASFMAPNASIPSLKTVIVTLLHAPSTRPFRLISVPSHTLLELTIIGLPWLEASLLITQCPLLEILKIGAPRFEIIPLVGAIAAIPSPSTTSHLVQLRKLDIHYSTLHLICQLLVMPCLRELTIRNASTREFGPTSEMTSSAPTDSTITGLWVLRLQSFDKLGGYIDVPKLVSILACNPSIHRLVIGTHEYFKMCEVLDLLSGNNPEVLDDPQLNNMGLLPHLQEVYFEASDNPEIEIRSIALDWRRTMMLLYARPSLKITINIKATESVRIIDDTHRHTLETHYSDRFRFIENS